MEKFLKGVLLMFVLAQTNVCRGQTCRSNDECSSHGHVCNLATTSCEQVLGQTCDMSSGCPGERYFCHNGQCTCNSQSVEVDGACISVLGRSCNSSTNCGTDRFTTDCIHNVCSCKKGFVQNNGHCQKVLYSHCTADKDCPLENTYCSRNRCRCVHGATQPKSLTPTCEFDLGKSCDTYRCYGYNKTCNKENICSCKPGYVNDGYKCISALEVEHCNDTLKDCGSDLTYECKDSKCQCAKGFITSNYSAICVTELDKSCISVNCTSSHASCDHRNSCSCITGYTEDLGHCVSLFDYTCKEREECSERDSNAICDTKCRCKSGFKINDGVCTKVHGKRCTTNDDCSPESHVVCNGNICSCEPAFGLYQDQCLRSNCQMDVEPLPFLGKRSPQYQTYQFEIVLDDSNLASGWYNLGSNLLASKNQNPKQWDCGALYPIYLNGPLSESQMDEMVIGLDVVTTVVVGGSDQSFLHEEFDVTIRMCGDDFHVFLDYQLPKMAAFCIGTTLPNRPGSTSIGRRLFFARESRNGQLYDVPYVIFTCNNRNLKDNNYAYNTWYVDGKPFKHRRIDATNIGDQNTLTELELIEGNIKSFGFVLQCEFEVRDQYGRFLSLSPSYPLSTDVVMNNGIVPRVFAGASNAHRILSSMPLGCARPVGDVSWNCTLHFDLLDEDRESACRYHVREPHKKCGVSLLGVTKYGDDHIYEHYNGGSYLRFRSDVHGVHRINTMATHVVVGNTGENYETMFLKGTFGEPAVATGHALWTFYKLSDLQFLPYGISTTSFRASGRCAFISPSPIGSFRHFEYPEAGTYLFYRSDIYPVQVQVHTEACRGSSGYCACALTIQNDDKIYHMSICNGLSVYTPISGHFVYYKGTNLAIYSLQDGSFISFMSSPYQLHVNNRFYLAEGLCSGKSKGIQKRDGMIASSSEDVMRSWLLPDVEILLRPAAYTVKYSWTESYHPCYCPSIKEILPQSETMEYRGALKCSLNTSCDKHHEGRVPWPRSLMPDYTVWSIQVSAESIIESGEHAWRFLCNFEGGSDNYRYKFEWIAGKKIIYTTDELPYINAADAHIEDQLIIDNANSDFILGSEIICGVAVYSLTGERLLNFLYSDTFRPAEIMSDTINILRGGDSAILVKTNIPLPLEVRQGLRFSIFDPHDAYDCSNSTIAIKRGSTSDSLYQHQSGQHSADKGLDEDGALKAGGTISIPIIIINNKYLSKEVYSLKLRVSHQGYGVVGRLTGEFEQHILVHVRDPGIWQRRYCYVSTDPRVGTADQTLYSYFAIGEHIMMRHKRLQFEVQVQSRTCNRIGSCSCGVTVRAGRDIFVINHCSETDHIVGFIQQADNVLIVRRRTQNRYQLYLPHGTVVRIYVVPRRWFIVNVFIYPSPADFGLIEGLCGNFNGNGMDDLTHRDGSMPDIQRRWNFFPNAFVESWSVSHEESLLNADRSEESYQSWNEMMCIWSNIAYNMTAEAVCSSNEERLCITGVERPGVVVNFQRTARSMAGNDLDMSHRLRSLRNKTTLPRIMKRDVDGDEFNITYEEASTQCYNALVERCPLFRLQDDTPASGVPTLHNCALDLQLNPNVSWDVINCELCETIIEQIVSNDNEFQEANPDMTAEIKEQTRCIGNCSNKGLCVGEDTCSCFNGYGSDDCNLDITKPVDVLNVQGGGICDVNVYDDCSQIRVTTQGHLLNAVCKVIIMEAIIGGPYKDVYDLVSDNCGSPTMYDIFCCWDLESFRKKRSANVDVTMYQVGFAISNDGTTFGSTQYVFVLDSTCQEVIPENGTAVAQLKTDFCFIDNVCYPSGNISAFDLCSSCDPSVSLYQWTTGQCATWKGENHEEDSIVYIIVGITLTVFVLVAVVVVVTVVKKWKSKRNVGPAHSHNPSTQSDVIRQKLVIEGPASVDLRPQTVSRPNSASSIQFTMATDLPCTLTDGEVEYVEMK